MLGTFVSLTYTVFPYSRGLTANFIFYFSFMKNKGTATVLAFFLGFLGIHRFYLGRTASGLLMFLFAWTLIPAIIAFVQGIMLLSMSEKDFNREYNSHKR